ncbi:uncharacterized protein LOC144822619 isoform X2 [Lissotriton helveticus]
MTQITSLGKPHATQQQIAEPTKELKCTVDEQNDCHVGSNAKAPSILPSRENIWPHTTDFASILHCCILSISYERITQQGFQLFEAPIRKRTSGLMTSFLPQHPRKRKDYRLGIPICCLMDSYWLMCYHDYRCHVG